MKRSPVVFAAILTVPLLVAAAWFARSAMRRPPPATSETSPRNVSEGAAATEMRALREEVKVLNRRLTATQSIVLEQAQGNGSASAVPADGVEETRSTEELRREVHKKLDDLLLTESATARERHESEAAVKQDLVHALAGAAALADVKCAATFCKLILEEDTGGAHQPLDIAALAATTKSLKQEALFAYETEGSRRRTIIYLAREGHLLPLSRPGSPTPISPTQL